MSPDMIRPLDQEGQEQEVQSILEKISLVVQNNPREM